MSGYMLSFLSSFTGLCRKLGIDLHQFTPIGCITRQSCEFERNFVQLKVFI